MGNDMKTVPTWQHELVQLHNVTELRQHCKRVKNHLFDRATVEFFGRKVVRGSFTVSQYGTFFVVLDERDMWGTYTPRYTVRQAMLDGVRTIGEFRYFRDRDQAKRAAYLCAVYGVDSDQVRAAFAAAQEEK